MTSADTFDVAELLLTGRAGRAPDYETALRLYRILGDAGHTAALLRSAVLIAEGQGCDKDWPCALRLLRRAAELGAESAGAQMRVLADSPTGTNWSDLEKAIDLDKLLQPEPLVRRSDRAGVGMSTGFATPRMADWIVALVEKSLQRSRTFDHTTGLEGPDESRTAFDATLDAQRRDLVCAVLEERAARLTGLPAVCHESPTVIRYGPGEQYKPHYDFIPPSLLEGDPKQKRRGQRTVTVVTYLSDDFDGGETAFPRLDLALKGAKGDALIWMNVIPDGTPDTLTLHAGTPPIRGAKWILSQWLRDRPQIAR